MSNVDGDLDSERHVVASELYLEEMVTGRFSHMQLDLLGIANDDDTTEDNLKDDALVNHVTPVHHGVKFEPMHTPGIVIPMKSRLISGFIFDEKDLFAGLTILDSTSGEVEEIVSPQQHTGTLTKIKVDQSILESAEHTRLIGFRTVKRCAESKHITGV